MTNNLKEDRIPEEFKRYLGSSLAHGYYLDDDAREKQFEEIVERVDALINQKEKEARLDEYAWYKREYPTAPYMPDFIIEDRIKQLKEELKGGKE